MPPNAFGNQNTPEQLTRLAATSRSIGLELLALTLEEFVNESLVLTSARKRELQQGLTAETPNLFHVLQSSLATLTSEVSAQGQALEGERLHALRAAHKGLTTLLRWAPLAPSQSAAQPYLHPVRCPDGRHGPD